MATQGKERSPLMACHNSLRTATQLWAALHPSRYHMDNHNMALKAGMRLQLLATLLLRSLACHQQVSRA